MCGRRIVVMELTLSIEMYQRELQWRDKICRIFSIEMRVIVKI